MDLNIVVLAGKLATAPEHRTFESGARLVRYLVTVTTDAPRRRVDVVPVSRWNPDQDAETDGLDTGDRIWAAGSVQRRFWSTPDGRRSRLEVVAHQVHKGDPDADSVVGGVPAAGPAA